MREHWKAGLEDGRRTLQHPRWHNNSTDKVFPVAVTTNGDDGKGPLKGRKDIWQVDYGRVTPLIVKARRSACRGA
jgi:hypothetical protein